MLRKTPNPTHAQALVTLRTGEEVPVLLRRMYVAEQQSQEAIARELGITRMTVAMWLREFGIRRDEVTA